MPVITKKKLLPPTEVCKRLLETQDPFFLTTQETAQFLRCSVRSIWRWLDEGEKFPGARQVSDGWLIPADDIRRIMGMKTGVPTPEPAPAPPAPKRPRGTGFVSRY